MATGLKNVGNAFGGPTSSKTFQTTSVIVDDDDDVVFIEPVVVPQKAPPAAPRSAGFSSTAKENHRADLKLHSSSKDLDTSKGAICETIIIDDEEEPEPSRVPDKNASTFTSRRLMDSNRAIRMDYPSSSGFSRNKPNAGLMSSGITTEPDSEIQIANVTTLDSGMNSVRDGHRQESGDMNLMITHVTSLQNPGMGEIPNGLQSASFGGHVPTFASPLTSQTKSTTGPYNPGRISVGGDVFQNGESITHHTSDAWISQSASFPRNQQSGVDNMSPVASLPKQVLQPPPPQQPSKAVKVTCANCKKPLQKGQTAYQRKGSTHLFCSTTCLSSFSQKPAPKKLCTMCKKDITAMKGTIVAQVDSSESFQEFCSTYCLSLYEDKQNSAKNQNKSRCTICGKLTEIRHEVSFKNMTHKLCSDHCFNRYRMANGLIMNCCEHCGEYLPSKGAGDNVLMVDGQWKKFCSPACLNEFKLKHGKLTSCTGCKAQCRIFDMTQCIGSNGHMEPYCSTTCMNAHKAKYAKPPPPPPPLPPVQTIIPIQNPGIICHFCKRNTLPQYQATMPDGKLYNFCSSGCVAKFQTLTIQSSTNGQHISDIQLKCNYCKNLFSCKPVTLEWEKKVHQFCGTVCCEDYKKLHCIVTFCEYCQEEKTLHDTVKFSGIKKPFCSEGCKLLYKQDFAKRLGLKCVTCNYCFQMCRRGATKEFDGKLRDFCTDDCSRKFQDWYYKAARCDCCRTQGTLKEKVQWRGIIKNFCDQQCLLRFYSQQNEPNMNTQKGPENMRLDQGVQVSRPRPTGPVSSCSPSASKDMKNKAVLCKPLSMTKATFCKPHMQTKSCQTEEDSNTKYVPVPIPVPVYIPVPMNLYSQKVPAPAPLPFPVPVPVLVPADLGKIKELNEELCPEDVELKEEDDLKAEQVKDEEMDDSILLIEDIQEDKKMKDEHQLDCEVLDEEEWHSVIKDEEKLEKDSLEEVVKENVKVEAAKEDFMMNDSPLQSEAVEDELLLKNDSPLQSEVVEDDFLLKNDSPLQSETVEHDSPLQSEAVEHDSPLQSEAVDDIPLQSETVEDNFLLKNDSPLQLEAVEDDSPLQSEALGDDSPLQLEAVEDDSPLQCEVVEDDFLLKNDSPLQCEAVEDDSPLQSEAVEDDSPLQSEAVEDDFLLKNDSPLQSVESDVLDITVDDQAMCGTDDDGLNKDVSTNYSAQSPAGLSGLVYEPELDLEIDFPRAAEEFDTESDFFLPPVFEEEYEDHPRPKPLKKGAKRKAVSDQSSNENCESFFPLKYSYGINAWKHWVKARIAADELTEYKSVRLKEDLLLHPPGVLSYWLSCFIKEVRRPNGDSYAPDSIYYLCLGIQEFLSASRKTENIFQDQGYETFGQAINNILRSWQPSILPDGSIFSRVKEHYLWQTNQLGTQSSISLLFTLFYFNTKYFNLRTVEQHLRLSFGSILKQWKGNPLTQEKKACLQYQESSLFESDSEDKVAPGKRKHEDDETILEQIENTADPSRCPVKIFEYYLSKSPQNLSQRMDVFYLTPESLSPGSSLWFTSTPLDRNTLENMLIRVLLVKDIYDKNSYELDEDRLNLESY